MNAYPNFFTAKHSMKVATSEMSRQSLGKYHVEPEDIQKHLRSIATLDDKPLFKPGLCWQVYGAQLLDSKKVNQDHSRIERYIFEKSYLLGGIFYFKDYLIPFNDF